MYFGGIGEEATLAALTDARVAVEQAVVIDEHDSVARFLWVVGEKRP